MGIQRDAQRLLGFAFLIELRLSKEFVKKSALMKAEGPLFPKEPCPLRMLEN
jgi:hypothetical protein